MGATATLSLSRTVALVATVHGRRRQQLGWGFCTPRPSSQVPRDDRAQINSYLSCPPWGEHQGTLILHTQSAAFLVLYVHPSIDFRSVGATSDPVSPDTH
ncbi:hypothetical protein TREES_T100010757 [Tupaia chinensis]|uniref:Uncharacterized protein n=1 Tax=Tupaia chinensis TaxID=246437 RepID=L9KK74_TUPCH|nr:hypothetical protein TREES_T100010757 [Tupaia chinensis]